MTWDDSKDSAAGDLQGQIQSILDNSANPKDQIHSIWTYFTRGLDPNQLNQLTKQYFGQAQNNLYGQQQRAAGGAGALAANQAFASGVSNPYAFQHHAANGIYGQYAGAFGNLQGDYMKQMMQNPLTAFQTQHAANQSNMQNLLQLLSLKGGQVANRTTGVGEQVVGGALDVGGKVAGKYI